MANIKNSVTKAFESTRDFRLSHDISERGASSLLSKVFTKSDASDMKFYRKPELAEGEETKLAILYGEVMITPYIIDLGVSAGTNDPENIKRTIRFIAGDGETEGVVTGPNGSPLENVYIGNDDAIPQPVIDSDGRPSTADVILASLLGAGISSIPSIWDAITDGLSDEEQVKDIDPITGAPIKSQAEREAEATIGRNLALGALSNVDDFANNNHDILVYDNCLKSWVTKNINDVLKDNVSIDGATGGAGGAGGAGGDGGAGGSGGDGGTGDTSVPGEDEPELPDTHPTQPTGNTQPGNKSMVELIDISELEDNEFFEEVYVDGTNAMYIHFFADGVGIDAEWDPSNTPKGDMPCLSDPNASTTPGPGPTLVTGSAIIDVCISIPVCGKEEIIYSSRHTISGISETSFTERTLPIKWCSTKLGPANWNLLDQFPGQIINSSTPIKVRLRRVDGFELGGDPQSKFAVYAEGYSFDFGNGWYGCQEIDAVLPEEELPTPNVPASIPDDGLFPDKGASGSLGPVTCPTTDPTIIPGIPPTSGEPGQPGTGGGDPVEGAPGGEGEVAIAEATPPPKIAISTPTSREYCKDDAGVMQVVELPEATTLESGLPDASITLSYEVVKGDGTFSLSETVPNVTVTGDGTRIMTLSGPDTDVKTATTKAVFLPAENAMGEVLWKIVGVNADGGCNGQIYTMVPCSLIIEESQPACAYFTVEGDITDTGTLMAFVETPAMGEKDLTFEPLTKANGETIEQFAQRIADDININAQDQNLMPVDNEFWLPLYTATAEGAKVTVCAPVGGGADFNDLSLRTETTGNVDIDWLDSLTDFFGGVTKNISDFAIDNPAWGSVGDVLLNIGGNVAGAVVTNMILNNSSSIQISIPESDADVSVAFLYRGRTVKMPAEYDAVGRNGTPDYQSWGGDWDNDSGTKVEWTTNPAWCLLDYIENPKYGLGQEIVLTTEQKDKLLNDIFMISAYCDEVTSSGPRFSLNTAITDGTKIEILGQLCSVFFGAYVFHNGGLRIRADHPDNNVRLLVNQTNADNFVYEHTTLKSFVNKVEVTYVEPGSFYTEEVVSVENTFGIEKYGEKKTQVFAFGVTDREQAKRYGRWILNSEMQNSLVVSYTGGWDHYNVLPGDIVQFEDSNERGERLAGRIKSISGTSVEFDGPIEVTTGDSFSVTQEDGTIHETTIASVASDTEVTISSAPSVNVLPYSTFIVADNKVGKQHYRIVKVDETADGRFNTTIQIYKTDKYNKIEG